MNERSRNYLHSGNEESRHPVLICVPNPMLVADGDAHVSTPGGPWRKVQCSAQSGEHLHSSPLSLLVTCPF